MDYMDIAYLGYMAEAEERARKEREGKDYVRRVADELIGNCSPVISRDEFEAACRRAGVDSDRFSQDDLERMVELMNR